MKNKKYSKYVNLSIFSILLLQFLMPIAAALEQSCSIQTNVSTQVNLSNTNQSLNLTLELGSFTYNSSINFTDTKTIILQRNFSCSYNVTADANTSILYNILNNLSTSAAIIAKDGADRAAYFPAYTNCLINYTTCQSELNISRSKDDFEQKFKDCVSQKATVEANNNACQNRLNDPASGCEAQKKSCEDTQKDVNNWYIGMFVAGALLGGGMVWWLKVKPKDGTDTMRQQPIRFE